MHFGENQLSPLSIGISPLPTAHPSGLQSTPVRPSTSCYGRFSLAMGSSSGFGSTRRDKRAVHTRFRCGSACNWLNRATPGNSPDHTPKGTPLAGSRRNLGLRLHVSIRFQGLFHSPRRGSFHRSLTVLCAIGRCVYLALGGGPPSFTPRCTCAVLLKSQGASEPPHRLPGCHGLWRRFPGVFGGWGVMRVGRQGHHPDLTTPQAQRLPPWHACGLGGSRFARHYYGNAVCSSGYVRCFSSPGALRQLTVSTLWRGCPIRRS